MPARRHASALLVPLALAAGCVSAGDRLNEGIRLQAQGRYMQAVYRYADAIERDPELAGARARIVPAGDSAIGVAVADAEELERRGNPFAAAELYRDVDRMLARVREVGMRLDPPADYAANRRRAFDTAIDWSMARGDEAAEAGRWSEAREHYAGARADFLDASRVQVEESYDAETRVLLEWAEVELEDGRPRAAHALAQEALEVRSSPSRDVVLGARELQGRALQAGKVVVAILPVTAVAGVREYLGTEFEVELDEDLALDHWNRPPLFIEVADPIILRRELRGLLRGQVQRSPTLVGRALSLVGADLGVIIELVRIQVTEEDVRSRSREAVVPRAAPSGRGANRQTDQPMDTVTFTLREGVRSYDLEANVVFVDRSGREVERFAAASRSRGPFRRGEFHGDASRLPLRPDEAPFFDETAQAQEIGRIEEQLLENLAVAIAAGTFDTILSEIP